MNFLKFGLFAMVFAMALFVMSCGGGEATTDDDGDKTEQNDDGEHDHEKDGHDHDGHEHGDSTSVDMDSKEYGSAYVCPMHCKDSGSDAEGKCEACGMSYVAKADHEKDGHNH